jgi:hypothetical protein
MRVSKLVGPLVFAVAAIACGGATDAGGLFGAPSSSGGVDAGHTGSSGGGSGSGSSGGGSGGSSGSGSGSGSSSGGGSGSSSGSGSGSGSGSSSGGSSSGGGEDAGSDPGIYCGTAGGGDTYCPVGKDVCCAKGSGTSLSLHCASAASTTCANGGGLAIQCDNEAECPGQLCCGTLDPTSDTYTSVQCQATCDPTQNQYIFCDPNAATDVCATIPTNGGPPYTCTESSLLTGFYRCSNGQ